jgi:hypothetical protein
MAESGHVTNIDINFESSWFHTDAQVAVESARRRRERDREGEGGGCK